MNRIYLTIVITLLSIIGGHAQFITLTTEVTNIKCPGDSTGQVIVFAHTSSVISSTHPLIFQITGPINGQITTTTNPNDTTATFTGLPEGSYVISVTDATPPPFNKIGFAAIAIGGIAQLESNPSSTPVSCVGLSDGDAIVSTTGGTFPYQYAWEGLSDIDSVANDIPAGEYNVKITDDNGCTVFDTIQVAEGDTLEAKFSLLNACLNDNTTITDESIGVDGSTNYTWTFGTGSTPANSSSSGDQSISYTTSGNKSVTLTLNNGTCTHSLTKNHTIHALPNITTTGDVIICETDTTTLTATGANTYLWTPVDSLSDPVSPTTEANPSTTTLYTVTGTDANNCTNSASLTISVNALPIINASPFPDTTICENNSVQLNATGGNSYEWTPNVALSDANSATPIATPLSNQTYKVVVSSGANCKDSTEITVNVNPAPTVSLTPDDSICSGETIELIATGGTGYDWFPKNGTLSSTNSSNTFATPLTTTTYTVVVSGANGCIDSSKVLIEVNPLPTTTITSNDTICENISKQLVATGGIQYDWTPTNGSLSSTSISSPIASPTSTTTYFVTTTDVKGCSKVDSVEIFVQPIPIADISPSPDTAICIGESVTLSATGGDTYTWLPGGQSTPNITVSPTSTQTFRVVASNGFNCTDTSNVDVIINPLPTINILSTPNDSICAGDSTQLTATGGINYSWSPTTNVSNPTNDITFVSPLSNTNYTVTVTDNNGCINTSSIDIDVLSLPIITLTENDTICIGESSTLTASGGDTYLWSPSNGLSSTNQSSTTATPTVTTDYIVAVSDVIGCTNFDTVHIEVNPLPIITSSNDREICSGDTIQLIATGGINYTWTPTTNLENANSDITNASPTTSTIYSVSVEDINGCIETGDVNITVNQLPILTATPAIDTICKLETTTLSVSGALTYTWSPDSTLNTNTGSSVNASPLTDHTYLIEGEDSKGCIGTTTAEVLIEPVITINIVNNDTICQGDTITLSAGVINGVSFRWSSATDIIGDPNQITTQAIPQTTQWFTLEVTNSADCINKDSLHVVVETAPLLSISTPNDSICAGDSTLLVAIGNGSTHTWFSPSQFAIGDSIIVTPLTTTNYRVLSETVGGCSKSVDTTIFVDPIPTASSTSDQSICIGDTIMLVATGGISYTWTPDTLISSTTNDTVFVSPINDITYSVEVFNSVGCSDISTTFIKVNQLPDVTIAGDSSICIGETTTLTATSASATSFSWSPIDSLSSPTTNITDAKPTTSTQYIVTVDDVNNCSNSDSIDIEVNALPVIITSSDALICEGESTILTASGGSTYEWTPTIGLSTNTGSPTTATPNTTTIYNVVATSNKGCINNEDVTVTVNPAPSGTLTLSEDTVCYGNEIIATGELSNGFLPNPFGSFSFDGGISFSDINQLTFTQLNEGDTTINIIFKDQFDCEVSSAISQVAHTLPQLTMSIDTIILPDCTPPPGEFRVFNLAGGLAPYTIQLNNGTPVLTNDTTYSNLSPGIYAITIADGFGCEIDQQLNFLSSITFDTVIVDPLCNNENTGSITITNVQGGVEPYTFSNDNQVSFSTNGDFQGLGDGLQTIYLKDNGNCLIELNFDLVEPTELNADELNTTDILCFGTETGRYSVEVTGGTKPYTASTNITSINGNGPFTFFNLAAGTNTVTIIDLNNCNETIDYTINDVLPIEAFFTEVSPPSGCNTADGNVTLDSTINGSGNYNYSIDGGTSFKNETTFKTDLTSLESGQYNVIIEDIVKGCIDTSTFTLQTANGVYLDSIRIDTVAPTCVGTDGQISLTNVFGAPTPYSFELRAIPTDSITNPFQPDSTITGISEGNYTVVIKDDLGCTYRLPVFMPGAQQLDFTTTVVDTKCGIDNGMITINATGGSGFYEYTLDTLIQTSNVFDSLAFNTYVVTLKDTTDSICVITKDITVNTSDINVVLDEDSVICFGQDNGLIRVLDLTNTDSTIFTYELGLDTLSFEANTLLFDSLTPGLHTLWIKQTNINDTTQTCFYPDWELYKNETIEDIFYDSLYTANFFIGTPQLLKGNTTTLPSSIDISDGTIFINEVSGGIPPYTYKIKEATSYFTYNNLDTVKNNVKGIGVGEYIVSIQDQNGCIEFLGATVGRKLYIPNIFTPNGDGKNDYFEISNLPTDNRLRIYDRWGIISYKKIGYQNQWDGKDQPDGTYYYELDTPTKTHKGWVQIVRN